MNRVRKRRTRRFAMPELTLTPLIDTALTLLVIFMVTAPMVQNSIKVDLPQGNAKEVHDQQELVVSMIFDEKINKIAYYFNSYPIEVAELGEAVKKALYGRDDLPVYVRADQSISYGKVIEAVNQLKESGVRLVAMSTRSITTS